MKNKNTLSIAEQLLLGYRDTEPSSINCEDGAGLKKTLSDEIAFEALLLEQNKIPSVLNDSDCELQWIEMISKAAGGYNEKILSDKQWKEIIEMAVCENKHSLKSKLPLQFPVIIKFCLAALIILAITGIISFNNHNSQINLLSDNKFHEKELPCARSNSENVYTDTTKIHCDEFPENRIMDIDSGSTALVSKNTELNNIEINNNTVSLRIRNGTALFSVAKKRRRQFTVKSKFADIIVTGTVFRVTDGDDYVLVNVNSGSVRVIHSPGKYEALLKAGQISIADKDTMIILEQDTIPQLPVRELLNTFLNRGYDKNDPYSMSAPVFNRPGVDSLLPNLKRKKIENIDSLFDIIIGQNGKKQSKKEILLDASRVLESKRNFVGALKAMEMINLIDENDKENNDILLRMCLLSLDVGDTCKALNGLIEISQSNLVETDNCGVIGKIYQIYLKRESIMQADSCLHKIIKCCSTGVLSIEMMLFEHANILRKKSVYEKALFWYEYILEKFPNSIYCTDAAYWASYSVVQNGINKQSARKYIDSSGW